MKRLRSRRLRPPPSSPALADLRRLRLRLTLLFTVALGLGLIVLAVVAVRKDSELRNESLQGEMEKRVTASSRLLYYSDHGVLRLDGVRDDDVTKGSPEIRVLAGVGPAPRVVFESIGPHLPLAYRQVAAISSRAAREGHTVAETIVDARGTDVRLVAGPFYGGRDGGPAGAVVSAASLAHVEAAHNALIVTVAIGCGVLVLLASGAGYLLAGRSLKPAARSLAQQEALLADAAHELRTPVSSIRASLEAAQLDPDAAEEAIERARATSERMGDTLGALLAWSRLEAGTELPGLTLLRLDQLVEDAVAEIADVELELETEPTVVRGDPVLIRAAVRNLVDNAARHGRGDEGASPVEVRVAEGVVTVSDRGPGLPPSILAGEVASPQAGAGGGIGLGLSIAARVAEMHRGSLEAGARNGGGASVRLVFATEPDRVRSVG